jgi:ABC-2 type transport system ATP-binding protein
MGNALRIQDLHKSFKTGFIPKTKNVLKGISFAVEEGRIFGYLGPNGAGKTTTIKCILGLIFPDRGTVEVFGRGHLAPGARERVGFLPENPYFYDYLTAEEFLSFCAGLFLLGGPEKRKRIGSLLKLVGLEKAQGVQLRKLSRGMLQRVGLAQALVNDPALVILDEPLGGLDPLGRKDIRDIIVRFKAEGKTVFLSSHILQDIEMICDRVAVIQDGKILSEGALHDLISEKVLFTEVTVSGVDPAELAAFGESLSVRGGRTLLKVAGTDRVDRVLELVRARNGRIDSLVPRTETLEDTFVEMVRRG